MAARKVNRKRLLKEPDEFLTFSARMIEFFQQNRKAVVGGVLAALLVLVASIGLMTYLKRQAEAAFDLLAKIERNYAASRAKADAKEALATVEQDLKRLVKEHGGRTAGRLGTYLYGAWLLEAGRTEPAIEKYQQVLKDLERYPGFRQIILSGLGHAWEQEQQWDKALSFYKKVKEADTWLMDDMALFQMGRLYEQIGKKEEGRKAFRQLVQEYPDSLYAGPAREKTST